MHYSRSRYKNVFILYLTINLIIVQNNNHDNHHIISKTNNEGELVLLNKHLAPQNYLSNLLLCFLTSLHACIPFWKKNFDVQHITEDFLIITNLKSHCKSTKYICVLPSKNMSLTKWK